MGVQDFHCKNVVFQHTYILQKFCMDGILLQPRYILTFNLPLSTFLALLHSICDISFLFSA